MSPGSQYHRRILLYVLLLGLFLMALFIPATIASNNSAPVSAPAAERLIIHYNNGSYELVTRTPLHKILPAPLHLPGATGEVRGNWFEVQSLSGKMLYRRPMSPPNVRYTEYRSPDNPSRLKREQAIVAERTFSILVPARSDAAYVVFFGAADVTKHRNLPAIEIGRLALR